MLIGVYLGFMFGFNVPECGKGKVSSENCNFEGFLDRKMFWNSSNWMIYPTDPEGIFTTATTALINPFVGICFSFFFRNYKENKKKVL
jgi:hypothetical protein